MSKQLVKVLGKERAEQIQKSKILLVGAGGIGCELLKNLVLTGYGEIHIVDLDTIDLSNLNRQFLFRLKDIKKFKSSTAVAAVSSFNFENSKLVSHTGNIMDTEQFPISWFDQFDFILNALDNLQARSYINKITQFLRKPLMESGTSGFDGYIQPMIPLETECFGCTTKETPKTFAVCTIRSTPSQPIHCIVWAKNFLFQQLFNKESGNNESNNSADLGTTDKQEIERIQNETNELKELTESLQSPMEEAPKVIAHILTKTFKNDIEKLLLIETLWQNREMPVPLSKEMISIPIDSLEKITRQEKLHLNEVWGLLDNVKCFVAATHRLMERFQVSDCTAIDFDKDDLDTLEFVATAANIRSHIFKIPIKSVFDIKQIAGNIIPAIATTNAIIAGLSSLSSLKFFNLMPNSPRELQTGTIKNLTMAFTAKASKISTNKYLTNPFVSKPNSKCPVCSKIVRGICKLSKSITVQDLINELALKYSFPEDLSIMDTTKGRLLYDLDFDDLLESPLHKILNSGSSKDANILYITDEEGDGNGMHLKPLELYLEFLDTDVSEIFLPTLTIPLVKEEQLNDEETNHENPAVQAKESGNEADFEVNESGAIILDDDDDDQEDVVNLSLNKKHDLTDKCEGPGLAKKVKLSETQEDSDDDLVILD